MAYSPSRTSQGYAASYQLYASAGGQLGYPAFVECWDAGFSELDSATADSHREYSMADAAEAFGRHAAFAADSGVLSKLASLYLEEWNRGVRTIEGVSAMLARLAQRFDLSIITNTHEADLVPAHLRQQGISALFSQVVTSVGFGTRKPSAAIFEFALDALAVSPGDCLYVGDSYVPDFEGPRSVGIRPLLNDPTRTAPVDASERIGEILELESVLAAV